MYCIVVSGDRPDRSVCWYVCMYETHFSIIHFVYAAVTQFAINYAINYLHACTIFLRVKQEHMETAVKAKMSTASYWYMYTETSFDV